MDPIHINIDDAAQVEALWQAYAHIARAGITDAARIAELLRIVATTRGELVGYLERRADNEELARLGVDGWNDQ